MCPLPTEKNKPVRDISKLRTLIYGPPKIGKSTLATQNPGALVLDTDNNGTEFLECFRVKISTWMDLKLALGELKKERDAGNERFNTIVIDTVDMAYQLCRQHVCAENGVNHESEDKSFGRIWDLVKAEWMKMIAFANSLGVGITMISHSVQKEVKIDGVKRTITTLSMSDKPGRMVTALADVIIYIDEDENDTRTLFLKPQAYLECGDRTKALTENIKFQTEKEAWDKLTGAMSK